MMNRLVLERSWSLYRVKAHDLLIFLRKTIQVGGSSICIYVKNRVMLIPQSIDILEIYAFFVHQIWRQASRLTDLYTLSA